MSGRGSPSALLIISAIDLLLASLVCGVVLFVALVGARGHNSNEKSASHAQARIPVTILYREDSQPGDQTGAIKVLDAKQIGAAEEASFEDVRYSGFEISLRGDVKYRWVSFLLKPNASRITLSRAPVQAYVAIHLGTEGSYYISMQCKERDWELSLSLKPLRILSESCKDRSDGWIGGLSIESGETPPVPILIVSSQVAPPEDWQRVLSFPDGTGTVSRWLGRDTAFPGNVSTAIFRY